MTGYEKQISQIPLLIHGAWPRRICPLPPEEGVHAVSVWNYDDEREGKNIPKGKGIAAIRGSRSLVGS